MQAGRLRHRITLQNFTQIKLPSGQRRQEWQDVATVWAEVRHISGRELLASGANLSETTVRVWLRYRADVTSAFRMVFRGQVYDIQAVIPDPKRTQLELLCKQGVKP
ncbi:phage head closure protein [Xenorhabdus griffiniae]|uniref:Phage head closure protein n=1 Tax=Xenorhabdus griffiniae TaxID=351672 RepID=A0ABY9XFH7_9GAMM|nr:phage head closure protein [Xenorhabdus griffiniae]MBD1229127.1 phage head closure protein [Xenorhabdus griffiniae]MBE8588942.1 phage head closure protein [Xenorhabdus griffiniae]WMV70961.1 phage head closure protein [Xenorhabdus griffiniae]WMV71660.1 phage head closure protein [Xenorhabdus griffiniae]WNH00637.1 phage head closure protein [Xenorhabdus griffiniae]